MEFLEALDQGTWNYFQELHRGRPILNALMVWLGQLASFPVLAGLIAVAALWLTYRRRWRDAGLLISIFAAAALISWVAQIIIDRHTPQVVIQPLEPISNSPSFPCDQTLLAAVGFLSLPCLATGRWRGRLLGAGAILVLLVGFSRIYVGHSFMTDVFAGLLMGYALALVFRELVGPEIDLTE